MIRDYLDRVQTEGELLNIDPTRILDELADHLQEAASAYEAAGRSRLEAESLAVGDLGDPSTILIPIASLRGVAMTKARITILAMGSIGMGAILTSHIAPPGEISGSLRYVAITGVGTLLAATALFLALSHRLAGIVAGLVGAGTTWAIATSAFADWGILGREYNYSPVLLAVGVAVAALAAWARVPGIVGVTAIAIGMAFLLLNGSWETLSGFGSGSANSGVLLSAFGWCWLIVVLVPWVTGWRRSLRRALASGFLWAGRKLETPQGEVRAS